jgi:8-hydroxy-5-deazaflavin:NADPH oxidoreductase
MSPTQVMTIGTIGAGNVAQAIARHAVNAGHRVILSNRRGPESLAGVVARLGPAASAGTVTEAATADIVILAVKWDQVPEAVRAVPDWCGRVVIDTTNQWDPIHNRDVELGDQTGTERNAELMPGARVVKAFNTLFTRAIAQDPRRADGRLIVFLAGDDADAKATVSAFIGSIGFAPVDIGGFREGRLMQYAHGPLVALEAVKVA